MADGLLRRSELCVNLAAKRNRRSNRLFKKRHAVEMGGEKSLALLNSVTDVMTKRLFWDAFKGKGEYTTGSPCSIYVIEAQSDKKHLAVLFWRSSLAIRGLAGTSNVHNVLGVCYGLIFFLVERYETERVTARARSGQNGRSLSDHFGWLFSIFGVLSAFFFITFFSRHLGHE